MVADSDLIGSSKKDCLTGSDSYPNCILIYCICAQNNIFNKLKKEIQVTTAFQKSI